MNCVTMLVGTGVDESTINRLVNGCATAVSREEVQIELPRIAHLIVIA